MLNKTHTFCLGVMLMLFSIIVESCLHTYGNMFCSVGIVLGSCWNRVGIAEVLKKEGFIKDFKNVPDDKQGVLRVYLKYGPLNQKIINHIKRESKPGRRIYKQVEDIGKVLNGIGISIYSTSKGILSNKECRENKIGGEHICTVW